MAMQFMKFQSDAAEDGLLLPSELKFEEQLSKPFELKLWLLSQSPNLDCEALLKAPARFGLLQDVGGGLTAFRYWEGRLSKVTVNMSGDWAEYHVVLVPDPYFCFHHHDRRSYVYLSRDDSIDEKGFPATITI